MKEFRYDAAEFVERAVRNVRPRRCVDVPRWTAIADAFGVGSRVACELCRAYGYDPNEIISAPKCDACLRDEQEGVE